MKKVAAIALAMLMMAAASAALAQTQVITLTVTGDALLGNNDPVNKTDYDFQRFYGGGKARFAIISGMIVGQVNNFDAALL